MAFVVVIVVGALGGLPAETVTQNHWESTGLGGKGSVSCGGELPWSLKGKGAAISVGGGGGWVLIPSPRSANLVIDITGFSARAGLL